MSEVKNRTRPTFGISTRFILSIRGPIAISITSGSGALSMMTSLGRMNELGFKMQFYKNCGQFGQLRNVENHAFVFSKTLATAL